MLRFGTAMLCFGKARRENLQRENEDLCAHLASRSPGAAEGRRRPASQRPVAAGSGGPRSLLGQRPETLELLLLAATTALKLVMKA